MTKLVSPSFPDGVGMMRSEQEVRCARLSMLDTITRCAGYQGMSDDGLADEKRAQEEIFCAMRIMRKAIRLVNHSSSLVKIDLDAWDAFVHDELPSEKSWDEKIAEARRA